MPTPNTKKTILALSIVHALASAAVAQTTEKPLQEVVVSAVRQSGGTAAIGGFSEAPLLQTPASISVTTLEQMQDLRIRQTTDAMKFDASVSDSYNAVGYAEQFSIRGF